MRDKVSTAVFYSLMAQRVSDGSCDREVVAVKEETMVTYRRSDTGECRTVTLTEWNKLVRSCEAERQRKR